MTTEAPPPLSHILETILYVRDLEIASKFYRDAFNVNPVVEIPVRMPCFMALLPADNV